MSEVTGDKVKFLSVPGNYKTGENVLVRYEIDANFETNSRDWVGVFCVGWTSNRDYYTFEWVKVENVEEEGKRVYNVKLSGSRLPPEDGHFYQFCYVTRNGVVKGASRPFQFTKTVARADSVGDLDDLVVVNEEDSLLFLRTRHESQIAELQKKVDHLSSAAVDIEAIKTDRDEINEKYAKTVALFEASQIEVANLKEAVEAKEEHVQKMKMKLEASEEQFAAVQKEIGFLQVSMVGRDEAAEAMSTEIKEQNKVIADLHKDRRERENQVQELGVQITVLVDENKRLKANEDSLREKCNQLEQENRELLECKEILESQLKYKETEADKSKEELEALRAHIVSLEEEGNELAAALEKEQEDKKKLMETARMKEQEANLAQQNLCEVLGTINEPRDLLNRQGSVENVDRSALEALQLAYTDVEKILRYEQRSNIRLKNKLAEMEVRVQVCRQEYEAVVVENAGLKKEMKKMKATNGATNEEATLLMLQKEYERLQLELQEFQLKHDARMDEKNGRITELTKERDDKVKEIDGRLTQEAALQKNIDTLMIEKRQLEAANHDLVQKLKEARSHRHHHRDVLVAPNYNPGYPPTVYSPGYPVQPSAPSPRVQQHRNNQQSSRPHLHGKVCPVCEEAYPESMSQLDFEAHVNSHLD